MKNSLLKQLDLTSSAYWYSLFISRNIRKMKMQKNLFKMFCEQG
jgi:hypothetical protein